MIKKRGRLFVLSGPSGTGKGTVCRHIAVRGEIEISVSATTRAPRKNESDGVSYYFISREEFLQRIEEDAFLEYAEVYGNFYGTPKAPLQKKLLAGIDIVLEIDMQGALKVKEKEPEAVLIYLLPSSLAELRKRLTGRGTETEDAVEMRLSKTREELACLPYYDYFVVNDELEAALADVRAIIRAEHHRVRNLSEELIRSLEK